MSAPTATSPNTQQPRATEALPPEAQGVKPLSENNSWFASKKQLRFVTASRLVNVSWEDEVRLRKEGADFIRDMVQMLRMPQHMARVMMTACLFFQRFYLLHDISDPAFSHLLCAVSCLFLACKVEECPMDLRHFMSVWYPKKHGRDAWERVKVWERIKVKTDPEGIRYEQEKERILMGERKVMERLGFDLHVSHPHNITSKLIDTIVDMAKGQGREDLTSVDGTKQLRTTAWNSLNDALKTTVCLQYETTLAAALAVQLSAQMTKMVLPQHVSEDGSLSVPWYLKPGMVPKAQSEDLFKRMVKDFHFQVYRLSDKLEAQRKVRRPTQSAPAPLGTGGGGGVTLSAPAVGQKRPAASAMTQSVDGSVVASTGVKRSAASAVTAPGCVGGEANDPSSLLTSSCLKPRADGASAPGSADRGSDDSIAETAPAVKRAKVETDAPPNDGVTA